MNKRGIWIFLFLFAILLFSVSVSANVESINKAYQCVENLVKDTTITLDEAIFSALAGVKNNKVMSVIDNERSTTENCWPKSACSVKTTAQVAIAFDQLGRDTTNIVKWLMSKNATVSGFTWYLQVTIDNNEQATCTANYDNTDYNFEIDNEMKIRGNAGSCLSADSSGYRMRISNSCLNKEFSVKCNKGFKINLLYEKSSGGTLYVSSKTESGSAESWKTLEINAKCFKEGSACNYEASLWATSALYAAGSNYEGFVPYLRVLAEDNPRLFPSAFLNYIESGNQHYSKIIEIKNDRPQERAYWDVGGNRYYDTALAMLALNGCDATNEDFCSNPDLKSAANYLFDEQTEQGCWNNNNLKDTAFLLYAGWPRGASSGGGSTPTDVSCSEIGGVCKGNCTATEDTSTASCTANGEICCVVDDGYNPPETNICENADFYCVSGRGSDTARFRCLEAGGDIQEQHQCSTFTEVCCTVEVRELTCSEQQGIICRNNEECSGSILSSSDGTCCLGTCEEMEEFECTENSDCGEDEECQDNECVPLFTAECSQDSDCLDGEICDSGICAEKQGSTWWIYLLIILIILVLIAILYRNKIKIWWFSRKGKGKSGQNNTSGPPRFGPGPPSGPGRMMPPRFVPPLQQRGRPTAPVRPIPQQQKIMPGRRPSEKDKEMEETLKKLKKMSE